MSYSTLLNGVENEEVKVIEQLPGVHKGCSVPSQIDMFRARKTFYTLLCEDSSQEILAKTAHATWSLIYQ